MKSALARAEAASEAGDWVEAVRLWRGLLDEFADAPPRAYVQLTRAHRALQDFEAAEEVVDLGWLINPGVGLAVERAEIAMERRDWAEAIRRWQRLLDEFGDEAPGGVGRRLRRAQRQLGIEGAERAMGEKDWAEAVRRWRRVLDEFGDDAPEGARRRLALAQERLAIERAEDTNQRDRPRGGFCPVCRADVDAFRPGPNGRPRARCPRCGALERHRLLAVLLSVFANEVAEARRMLEVAPTPAVARLLRERSAGRYVSMDLDPAADKRSVDVIGDLCAAPFGDGVFDLAVCFHVFEHIPDDRAAMAELARTLSRSALGFVQVPWNRSGPTEEDPGAPVDERVRRFGQADHVRLYGNDMENRLRASGLQPIRVAASRILPKEPMDAMALRGVIWMVTRIDGRFAEMSSDRMEAFIRDRLASLPEDAWRAGHDDPYLRNSTL